MGFVILVSLVLRLFDLVRIKKVNGKPSKRNAKIVHFLYLNTKDINLIISSTAFEYKKNMYGKSIKTLK